MAVNDDSSHAYQKVYSPSSNSIGPHGESNAFQRTRTSSPENERSSPTIFNPFYTGRPRTPVNVCRANTLDRQEIIKRIKSGGSRPTSPELERSGTYDRQEIARWSKNGRSRPTSPEQGAYPPGLYSGDVESSNARPSSHGGQSPRPPLLEAQQDNQVIGLQIERPRSALHRGDFRERDLTEPLFELQRSPHKDPPAPALSTSPVAPWHPRFPRGASRQDHDTEQLPTADRTSQVNPKTARERTISTSSLASSFIYKPPTSPLVQSSRPDTPEPPPRQQSRSPETPRRHTFSPEAFHNFKSALYNPESARNRAARPTPPLRSEKTVPYQAHQPRRSLNSPSSASLPQTPATGSRRPSMTIDSPLYNAPMVGSYEESILRGRMSTIPSRPLNFMAQIGVLGRGNCKSSLRCPPHVSVPFPAVFYSYGSGMKHPANDQPSPYVGLIDLENSLATYEEPRDKRQQRIHSTQSNQGSRTSSPKAREEGSASDAQKRRRRQKAKRRSGSPRAPPGGSYRIPQQGQLQIVIKNPNKTAVKLFLVPYDLSDMEPGQKTFIRQRSYSAGPIIDMPLSSRTNLGTDRPEAALSATGDPGDKPVLRYLIHLHICCSSRGRYFLYKSVRVVFANRVPDGKEKLRNETQLPEPRYSTYKPGRNSHSGASGPARDVARRRSEAEPDPMGETHWSTNAHSTAQSFPSHDLYSQCGRSPLSALPSRIETLSRPDSRASSRYFGQAMDIDSVSPAASSVRSPVSSTSEASSRTLPHLESPFHFFRDSSHERRTTTGGESLLSKRLMDLAFQGQGKQFHGLGEG